MEFMELIQKLLSIMTGFSFQLSVGALLCCAFSAKKSRFWLRLVPCLIVFNMLAEVIPGRYEWDVLMIGDWFSLSYLVMVCLLIGILCFCYKVKLVDACNYVAAAYSVQHIIFNLFILLMNGLKVSMGRWGALAIDLIVECVIWALFYFLFVKRIKDMEQSAENQKAQVTFSCITIVIVYVLSLWARECGQLNSAVMIYTILCCIFLLVIQFHIFERSKMQRDQEITKYLLQLTQKQYEQNVHNINLINIKCHDLKHQIGKLKHISDEEERNRYIAETQEAILIYDAFVKTGNKALDSVITEKGLVCQGKGIRLCSIIDGEAISFMEDADVYALFGNALDNAIASVEDESEEKRIITLNVIRQGSFVKIHMDNYCGDKLNFEDGLPATRNDADYHGFGCKSIKMIAEKYHGSVHMSREDDRFCLDILLIEK